MINKIFIFVMTVVITIAFLNPIMDSIDNLQTPVDYPYDFSQEAIYSSNFVDMNGFAWYETIPVINDGLSSHSLILDETRNGIVDELVLVTDGLYAVDYSLNFEMANPVNVSDEEYYYVRLCYTYDLQNINGDITATVRDDFDTDPVTDDPWTFDDDYFMGCEEYLSPQVDFYAEILSLDIDIDSTPATLTLSNIMWVYESGLDGNKTAQEMTDLYVDWVTFDYEQEPEPNIIHNIASVFPILIVASVLVGGVAYIKFSN